MYSELTVGYSVLLLDIVLCLAVSCCRMSVMQNKYITDDLCTFLTVYHIFNNVVTFCIYCYCYIFRFVVFLFLYSYLPLTIYYYY